MTRQEYEKISRSSFFHPSLCTYAISMMKCHKSLCTFCDANEIDKFKYSGYVRILDKLINLLWELKIRSLLR